MLELVIYYVFYPTLLVRRLSGAYCDQYSLLVTRNEHGIVIRLCILVSVVPRRVRSISGRGRPTTRLVSLIGCLFCRRCTLQRGNIRPTVDGVVRPYVNLLSSYVRGEASGVYATPRVMYGHVCDEREGCLLVRYGYGSLHHYETCTGPYRQSQSY